MDTVRHSLRDFSSAGAGSPGVVVIDLLAVMGSVRTSGKSAVREESYEGGYANTRVAAAPAAGRQ